MVPFLRTMPAATSNKNVRNFLQSHEVLIDLPLQDFNWELFISRAKGFFKKNFLPFIIFLSGGFAVFHYEKIILCIGKIYKAHLYCY